MDYLVEPSVTQGSVLTSGRWMQKKKARKRCEGKARPERCHVRTSQCALAGCEPGGKDHEAENMGSLRKLEKERTKVLP